MSHFNTNLAPFCDKIVALIKNVSQFKFVANNRQNCRSKKIWGNTNVCHHVFILNYIVLREAFKKNNEGGNTIIWS